MEGEMKGFGGQEQDGVFKSISTAFKILKWSFDQLGIYIAKWMRILTAYLKH